MQNLRCRYALNILNDRIERNCGEDNLHSRKALEGVFYFTALFGLMRDKEWRRRKKNESTGDDEEAEEGDLHE